MAKKGKMKTNKKVKETCLPKNSCGACGGGIYCLGFIGAAIYYLSTSTGFWGTLLALGKALVWPAFLVFEALKFLGA